MKTPDLKPCPFCGGEARRTVIENNLYAVMCCICGAITSAFWLRDSADEAWNRRVNDEKA